MIFNSYAFCVPTRFCVSLHSTIKPTLDLKLIKTEFECSTCCDGDSKGARSGIIARSIGEDVGDGGGPNREGFSRLVGAAQQDG